MGETRRREERKGRHEEEKAFVFPSRLPSRSLRLRVSLILLLLTSVGYAQEPATQPALDTPAIRSVLKFDNAIDHDVLTFSVPRDDLQVMIDGMPVPTAAGLVSHVWFYQCPCGRTRVTGELIVCDYEADDVVAAVHEPSAGYADIRVDGLSPLFSLEKPSMRVVRFHGEGDAQSLARRVAGMFDSIGDARNRKSTTMPSTTVRKIEKE